jgi:hypothetical protein
VPRLLLDAEDFLELARPDADLSDRVVLLARNVGVSLEPYTRYASSAARPAATVVGGGDLDGFCAVLGPNSLLGLRLVTPDNPDAPPLGLHVGRQSLDESRRGGAHRPPAPRYRVGRHRFAAFAHTPRRLKLREPPSVR